MKNDTIFIKNPKTGKPESINQRNVEKSGWGFSFFVDSELDAYRAAYQYRRNKHGLIVEYAAGAKEWMVTIFNENAEEIGVSK
jgi:hypothetical protein